MATCHDFWRNPEEGIRRYDAKRHAQLAEAFGGHDPGVCALIFHAVGLSLRGLPDQARRMMERALLPPNPYRIRRASGSPTSGQGLA